MPWLGQVGAVLDAWYPGQSNGTSLARVPFGQVDPSGHLPVTFPVSLVRSRPRPPPSSQGRTVRCSTPRASTSATAGMTQRGPQRASSRCSHSARGSPIRNLPLATCASGHPRSTGCTTSTCRQRSPMSGADVAQLYLGDPSSTGEPPRQLIGFQRVTLAPGRSARVQFTITPRDTWWWDDSAGGWSQTAGLYQVYVGDSSALANLPLNAAFDIVATPGARQVVFQAPSTMQPGQPSAVSVTLIASGDEPSGPSACRCNCPRGGPCPTRAARCSGSSRRRRLPRRRSWSRRRAGLRPPTP